MAELLKEKLTAELASIREQGLYKAERIILTSQSAQIAVAQGPVLNFCANNYLGLADNKEIIAAAKAAMDKYGFGLSSVRFICGTQDAHKQLEKKISEFIGKEDTILYSSCFDANGGLFETLLGENDAVISDTLNHASIIDGVRLCKAKRFRYEHMNMKDLEVQLQDADKQGAKIKLITTDGVFSMDGDIAPLDEICALAHKYQALVHVDDSHATGFVGKTGRGSIEYRNVMDKVDIVTSTMGKALGGACGGFTSGKKEVIEYLRNRSRPYLFSNTVAPAIVGATMKTLEMLSSTTALRDKLEANTQRFREKMTAAGFNIRPGVHPICPVMLGDAKLAGQLSEAMLKRGIYVIGFSFPVVPKGQARIRVQISAAHSFEQIDRCVNAFIEAGKELGIIH